LVRKTLDFGPQSGANRLARLDGRSRPALLMRRVRQELTAHVGGKPNFVQSPFGKGGRVG
jgi:hypothetical protein